MKDTCLEMQFGKVTFRETMEKKVKVVVTQSCPLCDPMDCSLTDSSVHGMLQATVLESVAILFSRGSS